MALEIERKFLVTSNNYKDQAFKMISITQGYLNKDPDRTVRIRIIDDKAVITIKSKTIGLTRNEFEYGIPLEQGKQIMELIDSASIKKKRYLVEFEGNIWEVDEFYSGLVIAEIELQDEDKHFIKPSWIGEEVSYDPKYYNSNL